MASTCADGYADAADGGEDVDVLAEVEADPDVGGVDEAGADDEDVQIGRAHV